jgi:hypothetical protein
MPAAYLQAQLAPRLLRQLGSCGALPTNYRRPSFRPAVAGPNNLGRFNEGSCEASRRLPANR